MSPSPDVRSPGAAATPLEQRYRRLLRLLPASYRAVWEEEMVATFLDSLHTDDPDEAEYRAHVGRPSRAERASVAALAVRLRLGGAEAPPRAFVWGEAVRRVALVGLLVYAVGGTVMAVQDLWVAGAVGWPAVPAELAAVADPAAPQAMDLVGTLTWVGAFVALVYGRRRTATVLAGLGLALTVAAAVGATVAQPAAGTLLGPWMLTRWVEQLVMVAVVLAVAAAFHRDAPRVLPGPWLAAYAVGVVLLAMLAVLSVVGPEPARALLDGPRVWSAAVAAAGAVHLLRHRFGQRSARRPSPAWLVALAALAAGALGLRLASLADFARASGAVRVPPGWLAAGLAEAAVLAAVGVALAIAAGAAVRGLPPEPAATRTPDP